LVDEAPVVKLVNSMILQAIRQRASDIHIEPQETRVRVRYRIDGALYNVMTPPKHIQAAIISRLKIMADMDIAERRLPQDGRIQLKADSRDIDLRVSTIPTVFGEKVVMRILDKSHTVVGIEKIGLLSDNRDRFESMIIKPYGNILLTGHLVLSTRHTTDAPGAVTRLVDMGIEPFLVASSLIGVIAQRLVRTLCERCKQPYAPPAEVLERLGAGMVAGDGQVPIYRPV